MYRDVAVALGGPSHFAVHWEPSQEVPIIVHDLPFSGANAAKGYCHIAIRQHLYFSFLMRPSVEAVILPPFCAARWRKYATK